MKEFDEETVHKSWAWLRKTIKGVKHPRARNRGLLSSPRWETAVTRMLSVCS